MDLVKVQKIFKLIVIALIIYAIYNSIGQQNKLYQYNQEINSYNTQISALNQKHDELIQKKENINSPEYIENIARENLEMYRPNERVYVDISR